VPDVNRPAPHNLEQAVASARRVVEYLVDDPGPTAVKRALAIAGGLLDFLEQQWQPAVTVRGSERDRLIGQVKEAHEQLESLRGELRQRDSMLAAIAVLARLNPKES
jgi:hypothetical protein